LKEKKPLKKNKLRKYLIEKVEVNKETRLSLFIKL